VDGDELWVAEQFAATELGDARRSRRACRLALGMVQAPGKGIPVQTRSWGNCKAAYRLLHCADVTRDALLQPHLEHTRSAAAQVPVTLFVQDTTTLDFSQMEQAHGYGPIGNHAGNGLFAHNLLALTPSGQVFGLAAQLCWARVAGVTHKHTETRTQRYARANKESEVWPKVLEAVGRVPQGCRWISIGDRGSDSFDYWSRAVSLGWQCLSRIFTNRRTAHNGHLLTQARALPVQGRLQLPQRARPGQAARTLHLNLAWREVQVLPTRNVPALAGFPPLAASVVRCWDARNDVEWLLLATWPINNFDDAAQCVLWYEQRWSIEEFHKCLKSGCNIERSQLKQAHAVEALLGFCSVVAVRLLALQRVARCCTDDPAAAHVDEDHLTVLCAKRNVELQALTIQGYLREVARLGGFLARTHDGDPGWQTLWRGLTLLDAWVDGYQLAKKCG
jgi:hypothetical protein